MSFEVYSGNLVKYSGDDIQVRIPDGVTVINSETFANTDIEYVFIPESVKCIGDGAFRNCKKLRQVQVAAAGCLNHIGDYAFYNCNELRDFIGNVESIGGSAFENCTGLGEVYIYDLKYIGERVFKGCTNLKAFQFKGSIKEISTGAFCGCTALWSVGLPTEINYIGNEAFRECSSLKLIHIPDNVVSIGNFAFADCENIEFLYIPANVDNIGACAFSGCSNLNYIDGIFNVSSIADGAFVGCDKLDIDGELVAKFGVGIYDKQKIISIKIPDGVTEILDGAFEGCFNLQEIIISEDVKHIGRRAFADCDKLTAIWIPGGVQTIEEETFEGCINLSLVSFGVGLKRIKSRAFEGCSSLRLISLTPVEYIGSEAFKNSGLREVDLPSIMEVIEEGVFADCKNLELVTFNASAYSNGISKIKDEAFSGCSRLKSIEIPDSVTEIGRCAFESSGLEQVSIGKGVRKISRDAFDGTPVYDNI